MVSGFSPPASPTPQAFPCSLLKDATYDRRDSSAKSSRMRFESRKLIVIYYVVDSVYEPSDFNSCHTALHCGLESSCFNFWVIKRMRSLCLNFVHNYRYGAMLFLTRCFLFVTALYSKARIDRSNTRLGFIETEFGYAAIFSSLLNSSVLLHVNQK